jgi:putative SOS response-associated peptidase YedK
MSGRFGLFRWPQTLSALPGFPERHPSHWSISPGTQVLMLRQLGGEPHAALARWGLTPAWLTDFAQTPAHARAETLAEQPMFREAYRQRRCVLPANGFYEWRGTQRKRPYWLSAAEGLLYFAAIWEAYPVSGHDYFSVAMVTRAANGLRRPVLLDEPARQAWLAAETPLDALEAFIHGPQPILRERPLSTLVNDPAVDGPECLTPA